jgi:EmrB/QacA subfamily drug resistance transporter
MPASARLPLILMLAGVFVAASDLTVVSTILPQIVFDLEIPLRTGLSQAAWIVNGYLVAYTLTLPLMGHVSDQFGRRNTFLCCLALFSAGSLVAGTAHSLEVMIAGRALQALGAGAMVPVTMAYVADVLPPERRPLVLGLVGAVDTAGWVIGPLYGALMVVFFQWRWVFFINAPFSILVGAGLWRYMRAPLYRDRQAVAVRDWRRIDWLGTATLTAALLALALALSGSQQESGGSPFAGQTGFNPLAAPLSVSALIAMLLFVWQERRAAQPLIPLGLFNDRTLAAACAANFLVGAALIIAMVDVPLFVNIAVAQTTADAPLLSGYALALFTLGMVGGSLAGGWLAVRRGYRLPSLGGVALAAAGFYLMASWRSGIALPGMAAGLMLCGVGFGVVISPLASAVINAAGANQRGTASALVLVLRLVGMALGLASLTTWGIYRLNVLTAALPPLNLADPVQAARFILEQARLVSVQVIGELFLAAALVCVLAILPVILMRDKLSNVMPGVWLGWR